MAIINTESTLAEAIVSSLLLDDSCSKHEKITSTERQCMVEKWTIICKEIIDHIVATTDVLPGSFKDTDNSSPIVGTGSVT